jgi:hypothetical protein
MIGSRRYRTISEMENPVTDETTWNFSRWRAYAATDRMFAAI